MNDENNLKSTQSTLQTFPFSKGVIERLTDGTLQQEITYEVNGLTHRYTCVGEDIPDLERDWAFKYLEIVTESHYPLVREPPDEDII